jgi:hypothetical protein
MDNAFQGCTSLASITISDNVIYIGGSAFSGTAWLNNQPDGLIYAGKIAYKYKGTMPANTSIVLQEGTKTINSQAFSDCTGLTSITIPASVSQIWENAFQGCTSLISVTFEGRITSANLVSTAFSGIGDLRTKYLATAGGIGTYTRPDGSSTTWTKQP